MSDPYADLPFEPQEPGRAESHDERVAREVARLRVMEDARRQLARERAGGPASFDAGTLAELLAQPAEPAWRVDGLIPAVAGTLLVAQRKTGKTTLVLNLARCLITGEPFLGRFDVEPVAGRVALLNFEVSGATLARWAYDAGLPADRLFVVNVRGRRNPFGHPDDREALARLLRSQETETVIVDPFGRAYAGASQNDAGEVGEWLTELDTFARAEVGARDIVLAAHAGWNGERTRGSSALEDWADVVMTLTRTQDLRAARYLRAEGRDVELDEDELIYDAPSRTLSLSGAGSRATVANTRRMGDLIAAVIDIVAKRPGITGRAIEAALREAEIPHQKGDHSKALAQAVNDGALDVAPGPRNAKCYTLAPTYPDLPRTHPGGTLSPTPTVPIGDGVGDGVPEVRPTPTPRPTCPDCGEPLTDPGATQRCRPHHQPQGAAA